MTFFRTEMYLCVHCDALCYLTSIDAFDYWCTSINVYHDFLKLNPMHLMCHQLLYIVQA